MEIAGKSYGDRRVSAYFKSLRFLTEPFAVFPRSPYVFLSQSYHKNRARTIIAGSPYGHPHDLSTGYGLTIFLKFVNVQTITKS